MLPNRQCHNVAVSILAHFLVGLCCRLRPNSSRGHMERDSRIEQPCPHILCTIQDLVGRRIFQGKDFPWPRFDNIYLVADLKMGWFGWSSSSIRFSLVSSFDRPTIGNIVVGLSTIVAECIRPTGSGLRSLSVFSPLGPALASAYSLNCFCREVGFVIVINGEPHWSSLDIFRVVFQ